MKRIHKNSSMGNLQTCIVDAAFNRDLTIWYFIAAIVKTSKPTKIVKRYSTITRTRNKIANKDAQNMPAMVRC